MNPEAALVELILSVFFFNCGARFKPGPHPYCLFLWVISSHYFWLCEDLYIVLHKFYWFIFLPTIHVLPFLQVLVKTRFVMHTHSKVQCNILFCCNFHFLLINYDEHPSYIYIYIYMCFLDYSIPWIILKYNYFALVLNEVLIYFWYQPCKICSFHIFHRFPGIKFSLNF